VVMIDWFWAKTTLTTKRWTRPRGRSCISENLVNR
jgi:hypothetical protein